MNSCVRIYIQDIPDNCPYLDADGNLYIDLPDKFSLEQERIAEKVNQIGKLQIGGTIGFNAPRTKKNDWIFDYYSNLLKLDAPDPRLFVSVTQGMFPIRQELLQVNGCNAKEWDLELIEYEEHWATKAKEKKLNTIDLGTFTLTKQNIIDRQDEASWSNGMDVIQFPAVDYGKGHSVNQSVIADYRPWHYPLPVLKLGMCEIGYNLECPFLETEIGSQIIMYLVRSDYDNNEELLRQNMFHVQVTDWSKQYLSFNEQSDIIIFTDIIFDPSGGYNIVNGSWSGIGTYTFTFKTRALLLGKWRIEIVKYVPAINGDVVLASQEVSQLPFPKVHEFLIETNEVDLLVGEQVKVKVVHIKDSPGPFNPPRMDFFRTEIASFSNKPIKVSYISGDEIDIAAIIDPDYTLFDLVSGVAHILDGRIDFNEISKTVTIYTPFDANIDEEVIEGYYRINQGYNNIVPHQVRRGETLVTNSRNQNREVLLAFKDSTDSVIDKLSLPESEPLFSMLIDMGGNRPSGRTDIKNPFFEPTYNDLTEVYNGVLFLPQLKDNTDNNRSYKIGPRIMIYAGRVELQHPSGTSPMAMVFEGTGYLVVPYAYQSIDPDRVIVPAITSEFQLIYGDMPNTLWYNGMGGDLYQKFWARMLAEEYNGNVVELSAIITQHNYQEWNFRDEYLARFNGQDFVGRLLLINDFHGCKRSVSKLAVLAQLQSSSDCFGEPVLVCDNHPTLTIEYDDPTYTFIAGGDVESNIESTKIEYRYIDDEEWTEATEISNPTGSFFVKLTQVYEDGCKTKTIMKFVDACGNQPELELTTGFDQNGNPVLFVSVGGIVISEVDTEVITYTINTLDADGEADGSGEEETYTDPIPIEPGDNGIRICVTLNLTYTDDCEGYTETQCLEFFPGTDFGDPPCVWDVEYWQNVSGVNFVDAPTGWSLPDPATADIKYIKKTNQVKRDGRWLVFKVTPTTVNHFGINFAEQRYTFGLITTGNEIEAYHCEPAN